MENERTPLQIAWRAWRDAGLTIQQSYELVHYWKSSPVWPSMDRPIN